MKVKFKFSEANLLQAYQIIKKYPTGQQKSAVMPLLYLAQEQNDNWINNDAMDYIANLLQIPPMNVYEVANFYTMYNKKPVGKYLIQICRTTPCWLCNSNDILEAVQKELKINIGETTKDNLFTLVEVECLGACIDAPVVQINDTYHEKLDSNKILAIIHELRSKEK